MCEPVDPVVYIDVFFLKPFEIYNKKKSYLSLFHVIRQRAEARCDESNMIRPYREQEEQASHHFLTCDAALMLKQPSG